MKAISATDKSVRDHSQSAKVYGAKITVTSKVGRASTGRYWFLLEDWLQLNRQPNPCYAKREFIAKLTADLDSQSGGAEQADRIRDSQISAIDAAIAKVG
jgi:hypothetical protein